MNATQPSAPRQKWMVFNCYFCNKPMRGTGQKRYIDPKTDHGVVKTRMHCDDCNYTLTTEVPYNKALTVIDADCLPTEEQLRQGVK